MQPCEASRPAERGGSKGQGLAKLRQQLFWGDRKRSAAGEPKPPGAPLPARGATPLAHRIEVPQETAEMREGSLPEGRRRPAAPGAAPKSLTPQERGHARI
jgi:hypothetical protein